MGASVVAGVDAAPVLELAEHILDFVALAVERSVEGERSLTVGFWRDAGFDTAPGERLTESVGIIAFVAEQDPGLG